MSKRILDTSLPKKISDGKYQSNCRLCNKKMVAGDMVKNVFHIQPNFKELVLIHVSCNGGQK